MFKKVLLLPFLALMSSSILADYGQYQNGDVIFNLDLNSYQFADKSKTKFTIDGNATGFINEQNMKKISKEFLDRTETQVKLYIDCKANTLSLVNIKLVDKETGKIYSQKDAATSNPQEAKSDIDKYMIKDLCKVKH